MASMNLKKVTLKKSFSAKSFASEPEISQTKKRDPNRNLEEGFRPDLPKPGYHK